MYSSPSCCLVRGSINIDEFFSVRDIVRPGETISSQELKRRAGGKGANQAVAIAQAGGKVTLVGAVGEDGIWIVEQLKGYGVDVGGLIIAKEPTGRAIIQIANNGENSIVLYKGANYTIIPPTLMLCTHLLLQNEVPIEDTRRYLSEAYAEHITTIFNPSPLPDVQDLENFPWDKLHWLIVNQGELDGLLDALSSAQRRRTAELAVPDDWPNNLSIRAAHTSLQFLVALEKFSPSSNIICTLGAAGVLALIVDIGYLYVPALQLHGEVTDTTGAGDCFAGYFVSGLMELHDYAHTKHHPNRSDYESMLRRCVQASGLCVQREGAMESIPTRTELKDSTFT